MVVLSPRPGDRIAIDGNIEIQVLQIGGNRVWLGVAVPSDVLVARADAEPRIPETDTRQLLIQEERRPGRGPGQTGDCVPYPE